MSLDESNDLTDLERRLAGWRPATGGLDRGRMLYEAGRASAIAENRRVVRTLSAVGLAFALATAGLGAGWTLERRRGVEWEAALASASTPAPIPSPSLAIPVRNETPPPRPPDPFSYLTLTRRIADGRIEFESPARSPRSDDRAPTPGPSPLRVGDRDRLLDL